MKLALDDYVGANSRPGLLLQRRAPTFDGRLSYFGGRPMLPRGAAWPRNTDGAAMPFVAQIDLSATPRDVSSIAPRDGVLHFFFDPRCNDHGDARTEVLYTPADQISELVRRDPPEDIPMIGGEHVNGGWTFGFESAAGAHFPRASFPKYEIDFVEYETIREPHHTEMDTLAVKPWDEAFHERRAHLLSQAMRRYWGCWTPDYVNLRGHDRYLALLDPNDTRQRAFFEPPVAPPPLAPFYEGWPHTWLMIGLHLVNFLCPKSHLERRATDEMIKEPFLEDVRHWMDAVRRNGQHTPVSPEDRAAYRAWLTRTYCAHANGWSNRNQEMRKAAAPKPKRSNMTGRLFGRRAKPTPSPGQELLARHPDDPKKDTHYWIWNGLKNWLGGASLDALTLFMDAEQPQREGLPPEALAVATPKPVAHYQHVHQLFGYGQNVQNAGADNADLVLLLQLSTDYEMLWMWADGGVLQFWIDTSDLANRRFDRVHVTLEGG